MSKELLPPPPPASLRLPRPALPAATQAGDVDAPGGRAQAGRIGSHTDVGRVSSVESGKRQGGRESEGETLSEMSSSIFSQAQGSPK